MGACRAEWGPNVVLASAEISIPKKKNVWQWSLFEQDILLFSSGSVDEFPCEHEETDYDLDLDSYQPIQRAHDQHVVAVITPKLSKVHVRDLQCLRHGSTVVHWEGNNSHSTICFLRLEADNTTLSWCKPQWSGLRGAVGVPDYVFSSKFETQGLVNKYAAGLPLLDDFEEGHIDVRLIKEVLLGESTADLNSISKRHGLEDLTRNNCISLLFGTNISDNRVLEFVLPSCIAKIWYRGLRKLVRAAMLLRRRYTDRRMIWLKEQYNQMVYENEKPQAPVLADAIKVGRN